MKGQGRRGGRWHPAVVPGADEALAITAPDEVEAPEVEAPQEPQHRFIITRHEVSPILQAFAPRGRTETEPFTPPSRNAVLSSTRIVSSECVEAVWWVLLPD